MANCTEHPNHSHQHTAGCGHRGIIHDGHTDYLHDGHMHNHHAGHVDEHRFSVGAANPAACTPSHNCTGHDPAHKHSNNCGHSAVPHGDHYDYMVGTHLHHPHDGHCDDHGPVVGV